MKITKTRLTAKVVKSENPITGEWEQAQWLPDLFSHGFYGVKFSTHTFDQRYVDISVDKEDGSAIIQVLAIKPEVVTKRIYEPYRNWQATKGLAAAKTTKKKGSVKEPSRIAAESNTKEMRRLQSEEGGV